ncbi:MAG: glucosamine-6-phosphate deaminase [Oscillospiraceae bacterium]|nr:glucosamine-6-phosphate deaminase [Oscillospiraceae bacterium]
MKLTVTESFEQSSRRTADLFESCIRKKPDALLGLATGSSVVPLYRIFSEDCAAGKADFSKCCTINVDEYIGLPNDHPQSFAYFMQTHLFGKTNFSAQNIYLVDGAADPAKEADRFNRYLRAKRIDILLLGIGGNGHIGFNEPGDRFIAPAHTVELSEQTVAANARMFKSADEVPRMAFTIGVRDVVRANKVVLIASGASKADAVGRLFADDCIDPMLPASVIKLCDDAEVIIDEELAEAAGLRS